MKKPIITLFTAMMLLGMRAHAQNTNIPVVPVGCQTQQATPSCEKTYPQTCTTPVFNSCEEIQEWKVKYFEKRCNIYTQLGLSQEQRIKAKTLDEKYFDEIAPLKMCCKIEKAKYAEMKCQKCKWSKRREQKEKINDLKAEIKEKKKEHIKCFEEILTTCQKNSYKKYKKDDLKCKC